MKQLICAIVLLCSVLEGFAQTDATTIYVNKEKTFVIVFPANILMADRGSSDIIAKVPEKTPHILKLKATSDTMKPTNVSVYTADEKLSTFTVVYNVNPATQSLDLRTAENDRQTGNDVSLTNTELSDYMKVVGNLPARKLNKIKRGDCQLRLSGLYTKNNTLFFRFTLSNKSAIPYPVAFMKFFIQDKGKVKRGAVMEKELTPINNPSATLIPPGREVTFVYAFPSFTIAPSRKLSVECYETGGDRQLNIHLTSQRLLKARILPL